MWKSSFLFLGLFFFQPVSDHSEAEDGNGSIAKQGNDERDDEVCGVGNDAHQKESAAAHRCHHEDGRCALGEAAQSAYGQREDGGEHDGLEQVDAQQGHQRDDAQIH